MIRRVRVLLPLVSSPFIVHACFFFSRSTFGGVMRPRRNNHDKIHQRLFAVRNGTEHPHVLDTYSVARVHTWHSSHRDPHHCYCCCCAKLDACFSKRITTTIATTRSACGATLEKHTRLERKEERLTLLIEPARYKLNVTTRQCTTPAPPPARLHCYTSSHKTYNSKTDTPVKTAPLAKGGGTASSAAV